MRTNFPVSSGAGVKGKRRCSRAGLTILEMLVSSAMLALIIVGLTAMFVQTQKAFKTGIKQIDVGDTGLTTVQMISGDLAQLSDGLGLNTNLPIAGVSNMVNLMWSWSNGYAQSEDGTPFRTNQLQDIYMLVHTNTGWMGIGYAVSNMSPGIGVGTLYRYISPVNSHYIDNTILYSPFLQAFAPNFSNQVSMANPNIRLSRIADGVVHLKIRVYDSAGNQVGVETNYGVGEFSSGRLFRNSYPITNRFVNPPVAIGLPSSIDLELGILEPDAWDHLKGLFGNHAAQVTYLAESAGKVDIFHQRILVRAAALQ